MTAEDKPVEGPCSLCDQLFGARSAEDKARAHENVKFYWPLMVGVLMSLIPLLPPDYCWIRLVISARHCNCGVLGARDNQPGSC